MRYFLSSRLKFVFIFLLLLCLPFKIFSEIPEELFNKNITEEELQTLSESKALIRNLRSCKNLCFTGKNEGLTKVQETARELKPAYVAEIIQILPYEGNENDPLQLQVSSLDYDSFIG